MIPKTIHYCWLSGGPIPLKLQECMKTWHEKLAGYEFVLWDLDRFDINSSPWVKQAFEAKKYAFAADYIRLYAVYHYGGIYLDMDVEVVKPFDDLLDKPLMLAFEDNKTKAIEAGCFGAEAGHPFVKACMDYLAGREFTLKIIEDGYTLPRIMKKIYTEHPEFRTLPFYTQDYFTAKKFRTGVIVRTANTYTIHHFAGSWFSDEEKQSRALAEKIAARFGDNAFSVFLILFAAFCSRVKRQGIAKACAYYLKRPTGNKPKKLDAVRILDGKISKYNTINDIFKK